VFRHYLTQDQDPPLHASLSRCMPHKKLEWSSSLCMFSLLMRWNCLINKENKKEKSSSENIVAGGALQHEYAMIIDRVFL
jgi:hypothetical protein